MATNLTFNEIAKYEHGIICDLLFASYAEILDKDLRNWKGNVSIRRISIEQSTTKWN